MVIWIHSCKNPKGHFGYGCGSGCFEAVPAAEVADEAFDRYVDGEACMGVHEAVVSALESFQPTPHPDAGYSEPIRD